MRHSHKAQSLSCSPYSQCMCVGVYVCGSFVAEIQSSRKDEYCNRCDSDTGLSNVDAAEVYIFLFYRSMAGGGQPPVEVGDKERGHHQKKKKKKRQLVHTEYVQSVIEYESSISYP